LNWTTSEWTLKMMESRENIQEEVCRKHTPFDVPMPGQSNFTASQQLCRKYGGNMTVVMSVMKQDELWKNGHYQKMIKENHELGKGLITRQLKMRF
jgi:hypothetical protein